MVPGFLLIASSKSEETIRNHCIINWESMRKKLIPRRTFVRPVIISGISRVEFDRDTMEAILVAGHLFFRTEITSFFLLRDISTFERSLMVSMPSEV